MLRVMVEQLGADVRREIQPLNGVIASNSLKGRMVEDLIRFQKLIVKLNKIHGGFYISPSAVGALQRDFKWLIKALGLHPGGKIRFIVDQIGSKKKSDPGTPG